MDPHLAALIRRNSKKPLPELKLELMKRGFSSYQIENALEELKIKDWPLIRTFAVVLVLAVVVLAIGFVFVSFVEPAEKLISREIPGAENILPSVQQENVVQDNANEQVISDKTETVTTPSSLLLPPVTKSLEEIRELSVLQKEKALSECISIEERDSCISLVARSTNDAELCSNILDIQKKDYCFYFFGQANREFCDRISSSTLRNYCNTVAGINQKIQ